MPPEPPLANVELDVIGLLGVLYTRISTEIVDDGPTRESDLAEIAFHIHALQRLVGAQAAARAYPALFRRLGAVLLPPV